MQPVYVVEDTHDDGVRCYVRAANEGDAITAAIKADQSGSLEESEPSDLEATRVPAFDADLSEAALIRSGRMWTHCTCGELLQARWNEDYPGTPSVNHDNEPFVVFVSPEGGVYCSEACWQARKHYEERTALDAICLYSDV